RILGKFSKDYFSAYLTRGEFFDQAAVAQIQLENRRIGQIQCRRKTQHHILRPRLQAVLAIAERKLKALEIRFENRHRSGLEISVIAARLQTCPAKLRRDIFSR